MYLLSGTKYMAQMDVACVAGSGVLRLLFRSILLCKIALHHIVVWPGLV